MNEAPQSRSYPFRASIATWWAVPLRVIVGYGFIAHGFAKLSRGPSGFSNTLHALGVPAPDVMAWATILVELVGGFAVLMGAFVSVASIPLAVVLLVAMFTVHLPYGFSSIKLVAVTGAGPQFGPQGMKSRFCISHLSRPSLQVGPDLSRSTAFVCDVNNWAVAATRSKVWADVHD